MTGALKEQSSGASSRARKAHVYSGQSAEAFLRRRPSREEAPATRRRQDAAQGTRASCQGQFKKLADVRD